MVDYTLVRSLVDRVKTAPELVRREEVVLTSLALFLAADAGAKDLAVKLAA